MPRHYGYTLHGTTADDLLQFEFIKIAPSMTGEKYILMLRDDHSNYK